MAATSIKLSDREKRILATLQLRAKSSAEEIALLCDTKVRSIQVLMRKLIDAGFMYRRPMINFSVLGFETGSVLLETSGGDEMTSQIMAHLESSPLVRVYQHLGSPFTLHVDLITKDLSEVSDFLSRLSDRFRDHIDRFFYFPMVEFLLLGNRIISPEVEQGPAVGWVHQKSNFEADELDYQIIAHAIGGESFKVSAVAQGLGQNKSTISYRISKLEQAGVISGYYWAFATPQLGYSYFNILVSTHSYSNELRERLISFAKQDLYIDVYSRYINNPQFHLGVATDNHRQVHELTQRLKLEFGKSIYSMEVAPLVQVFGVKNFKVKGFRIQ